VLVNDKAVLKAGTPVPSTANVIITAEQPKFVCRAGLKLEAALDHFKIDPTGFSALDSGLSTGGFTDCLLQRGAVKVVGVDVGYGQVAEKVRVDPRVTILERTNLRHFRRVDLPDQAHVDLVTLDLSFISSLKMRETVCDVLKLHGGQLLLLIKPQFEAGKAEVNTGGVVRDPEVRAKVVNSVIEGWKEVGFECLGWMESPIKGATSGNTEYLAHFVRNGKEVNVVTRSAEAAEEEKNE
jgi:23S rRNA (cytidine1920-2'-O)/16S rRNA (cytidine1409-2'-O)-methyltransferase